MWRLYLKKSPLNTYSRLLGGIKDMFLVSTAQWLTLSLNVADWNWNKDLQTLSDDTQVEPRPVWISFIAAEAQLLLELK